MNRTRAIRQLLTALLLLPFCVAADSQPVQIDPHQHLNQILERPLYRAWKLREESRVHDVKIPTEGFGEWVQHTLEAIGKFINWLLTPRSRQMGSSSSGGASLLPSVLEALALTLAIAAVLLIAFFIFRSNSAARDAVSAARILSRQQIEAALESGNALALDASQWLNEAQRLAAEQNFRAMYRALYLALLSGLHSAGKIEHDRNRTNWTYVQLYRGPDQERVIFSELTEVFDRVWYGRKIVPEHDKFDELREKVAMLTTARREGSSSALLSERR